MNTANVLHYSRESRYVVVGVYKDLMRNTLSASFSSHYFTNSAISVKLHS